MPVERKYVLTKLGVGDYLLPSNDAQTLWRIRSYEDGPTWGLDPEVFPRDFKLWSIYRWTGNAEDAHAIAASVENDDFDLWETYDQGGYRTRREAVEAALAAQPIVRVDRPSAAAWPYRATCGGALVPPRRLPRAPGLDI